MLIVTAHLCARVRVFTLRPRGDAPGIIAIGRVVPGDILAQAIAVVQIVTEAMIRIDRYAQGQVKLRIVVFILVMGLAPGEGDAEVFPAPQIKVIACGNASGRGRGFVPPGLTQYVDVEVER